MIFRFVLSALLATAALTTSAEASSLNALASCVGRQFAQLQETNPVDQSKDSAAAICMGRQSISVCRRMLEGDQAGDNTMKISLSIDGSVIREWLESADPAYLRRIHVFVKQDSNQKKTLPPQIIVATQQSESQGMGVQEWQVNVIDSTGHQTFKSSEFGPTGSLVFDRSKRTPACELLLTRWESRQTRAGERLFLMGDLVELETSRSRERAPKPLASRRLDRHLAQLRAIAPPSRPLSYFTRSRR